MEKLMDLYEEVYGEMVHKDKFQEFGKILEACGWRRREYYYWERDGFAIVYFFKGMTAGSGWVYRDHPGVNLRRHYQLTDKIMDLDPDIQDFIIYNIDLFTKIYWETKD